MRDTLSSETHQPILGGQADEFAFLLHAEFSMEIPAHRLNGRRSQIEAFGGVRIVATIADDGEDELFGER